MKKIYAGLLILMALMLAACEQNAENTESNVSNKSEISEKSEVSDKSNTKDRIISDVTVLDEEHFEKYNEDFRNSDRYDAVFENRCFYINGTKVYMPTTVRGFEKLLDTEFTSVSFDGGYWINYCNDNREILSVLMPSEEKSEVTGSDFLDESKDIELSGIIFSSKEMQDSKDIWLKYQVEFESVGYEQVNEYGYYKSYSMKGDSPTYRFYPACFQAYYEYIKETLPQQSYNSDYDYRISSIIDYSGGEDNVQIGFGDVTCDALDEMIIMTKSEYYEDGYRDVRIFTYDTKDKKLREIYYEFLDIESIVGRHDYVSVGTGILSLETRIDNMEEASERISYTVFNRYGSEWKVADFQTRYDRQTYEKSYLVNNTAVTKEEYYDIKDIYDNGGLYFSYLDGVIGELSTTATLTAQGMYINDLSYKDLKEAIKKIDLDAIGYDADQKDEYEMDSEAIEYNADYDEERAKLMEQIAEDTQRIVDSVAENTLAGPPDFREATPEDFDIHCEIKSYNEIDAEKLEIFFMSGYPDEFFNVMSTFIEECNITTKIEYSDAGTDLEMPGYDGIMLFANNTNYLIFYNDTEMFIKEI